MAERIKKSERLPEDRPAALGELIHAPVRVGIETAMHEELAMALGPGAYEPAPGSRVASRPLSIKFSKTC